MDNMQGEESRAFLDVDQKLYDHERPLYRYCASGGGSDPMMNPEWVAERKRLEKLWMELCPYTPHINTTPKRRWYAGVTVVLDWFRQRRPA